MTLRQIFRDANRSAALLGGDRNGNIALIMALTLPILAAGIGIAIDFSESVSIRARLTNAADAAVLAGLKAGSEAKSKGKGNWSDIAEKEARNFFDAYIQSERIEQVSFTPRYGDMVTSLVGEARYQYRQPTFLMGMFGFPTVTVAQVPRATIGALSYLDVTFVIDNSTSMGIGATLADRNLMNSKNGNCAFACHQANSSGDLKFAPPSIHQFGAKLRIDVIREAVDKAVDDITERAPAPGQVQFSVYTFSHEMETLLPPTTNTATAKAAVSKLDLVKGSVGGRRYADTLITPALLNVASTIHSRPGNNSGSSTSNRKRYVIFISDGVEDSASFLTDGVRKIGLNALQQLIFGVPTVPKFTTWDVSKGVGWVDHPRMAYPSNISFMQPFVQKGCDSLKNEAIVYTTQIKYEKEGIIQRPGIDVDKIKYLDMVAGDIESAFKTCATTPDKAFLAETTSDIKATIDKLISEILPPSRLRLTN